MNFPTLIVATAVAIIFIAIVARHFINKRKGQGSCACGGSCGGCGTKDTCQH